MKNNYTLIYSLNNVEKDENYLIGISELDVEEEFEEALNQIDLSPRQEIVDNLLAYAKKS